MVNDKNIKIQSNQKFSAASLGYFVRLPLTQHNLALATLLTKMQGNASESYPDPAMIAARFSELYSFRFEAAPQLFGKELVISYLVDFVEPQEILDPDYNYREIMETFIDLVTNPLLVAKNLELSQRQLRDEYQELVAQPNNRALIDFFNYWYQDQPDYAASFLGPIEEIEAATVQDVRRFFDSLESCPSCLLGQAYDARQVARLANEGLDASGLSLAFPMSDLAIAAPDLRFAKAAEQGNQQAQLFLGYGYKALPTLTDLACGTVLREYLTGEQSSRLFAKVREEKGAAYAVESNWYADNSLFLINAGLDPGKVELTEQIIAKEMQMVADGRIDPGLLKQSKQALVNRQLINQDSSAWLLARKIRYALHENYEGFNFAQAVKAVTSKDLANFVKNLYLNESYVLK